MSAPSWCLIGAFVIIIFQQIAPIASQKLGKCPTARVKPECPPPVALCSVDVDCRGSQKCCDDGCSGSECREAEAMPPKETTGSGCGPIWTRLMVGNSAKSSGQRSTQHRKDGKCPTAAEKPECAPPVSLCSVDDDCPGSQKCCDDGCAVSHCLEPRGLTGRGSGSIWTTPSLMVGNSAKSSGQRSTLPRRKDGKCPTPPEKPECAPPVSLCSVDDDCPGSKKCCDDGCAGSHCLEPRSLTGRGSGSIWTTPSLMVGNSTKSSRQRSKLLAKVGKCPTAPAMPECPLVPIKLCSFDGECPLNQKCCDDGCFGLKCQEPCMT